MTSVAVDACLCSPLDDVVASGDLGKKLADEFTQVASSLRSVFDAPTHVDAQHDRACRLNLQLQHIVADIRKLPGLSRFLQPPLFSDLQVAAASGPVIIVNASQYSCDAVVLLSDQDPLHVTLPVTKARVSELSLELRSLMHCAKSEDVRKEILVFLRQLWDEIVFPIVKILQDFCPRLSRIWWCPTAEFSLLPLHAASPFKKGRPIQSVATLTCVQDQDANIAKVGEELMKNDFVHLACHGLAGQKDPFESGFALDDGLLKIEDIMRYNLQNAKFAYLSACHTTVGDEESPDEMIHLAAAVQFAGFRSVIGTMWAVDVMLTQTRSPRSFTTICWTSLVTWIILTQPWRCTR